MTYEETCEYKERGGGESVGERGNEKVEEEEEDKIENEKEK